MNVSPVPPLLQLLWCGMAVDPAGLVADTSKPLLQRALPCCFWKPCRENTLLTQPLKGKEAISLYTVSTPHGTSLKLARCFLFWILLEAFQSNLPPVRLWLCKCVMVTSAPQNSQCFEPKNEVYSKWQVIFCLPIPSLVLPTSTLCLPSAWYRGWEMEIEQVKQ